MNYCERNSTSLFKFFTQIEGTTDVRVALEESQMDTSKDTSFKDEQQARDLLTWSDGIGTLEGCDLRFKLNQLGCLELLDSDDESENHNLPKQNAISTNTTMKTTNQPTHDAININKTSNGLVSGPVSSTNTSTVTINNINTNAIKNTDTMDESAYTAGGVTDTISVERFHKRAKLDPEQASVRQISPGSSLLRDGPNIRRPKTSSNSSLGSSGRLQSNSLLLLKKLENNQNSILLDKLVPKQRLDKIRTTNVEKWSIEDVKNFVDSIPGCSGHGELFESQQICGKSLMYLDQRDLLDVINVKLGPAVKICHAISLLK